jgi:hypothetical protein
MPTESVDDRFEKRLDTAMKRLQECQQQHDVASCNLCEHCIGCETRQAYVQAVYDSMSKGETGGFDF